MKLECAGRTLDLSRPQVMGIINVTPDSFSDGGRFRRLDAALAQARQMVNDGAAILDIGGESTRPGAPEVTLEEELNRVVPVVEAISSELDVVISVDTSKAQVMREAVASGAGLINDVRALEEPGALAAAVDLQVPVCLMHMQGQPRTMQQQPVYEDLLAEVSRVFEARIQACVDAGMVRERLLLDPGFGFGKTLEHNYQLLARLDRFRHFGLPLLTGLSRKSMFGQLLGRAVDQRLPASLAGALLCAQGGASVLRVHDVRETVDVLKVLAETQKWQDG
ncbi:dihydropteroate synthase [Ferrimonas sediminicola]|uniref:Dihydropteroate synthase n=1 Tax=Ferrimonas sediminicola TaxID=2569538 RepID=A0A4U1BEK1_9GAMM|nr:dihydropteroate synthase [Ferrimonas sediminicola]TKB49285.1 dihydropteroate synthase [Ferrimonas sediminicola]